MGRGAGDKGRGTRVLLVPMLPSFIDRLNEAIALAVEEFAIITGKNTHTHTQDQQRRTFNLIKR